MRLIARGAPADVTRAVTAAGAADPVLVFDDATGRVVDLDPRDTADSIKHMKERDGLDAAAPRGRGRPKLGVVAREVTLLPRHWTWLAAQPGGASQALRRLVDAARRADGGRTEARAAHDRAYRFMAAIAGDLPGFEEAARALFAGDIAAFAQRLASWPQDVRTHVLALAETAGPQSEP
jgi:hypothetical protein